MSCKKSFAILLTICLVAALLSACGPRQNQQGMPPQDETTAPVQYAPPLAEPFLDEEDPPAEQPPGDMAQPNVVFEPALPPAPHDGADPFQIPPMPISTALFTRSEILIMSYPATPDDEGDYFYRLAAWLAARLFYGIDLGGLSPAQAEDPLLTGTGPRILVSATFLTDDGVLAESYTVMFFRDSGMASFYGNIFDGTDSLWFFSVYQLPPGLFDTLQQRVTQYEQYGLPGGPGRW